MKILELAREIGGFSSELRRKLPSAIQDDAGARDPSLESIEIQLRIVRSVRRFAFDKN